MNEQHQQVYGEMKAAKLSPDANAKLVELTKGVALAMTNAGIDYVLKNVNTVQLQPTIVAFLTLGLTEFKMWLNDVVK